MNGTDWLDLSNRTFFDFNHLNYAEIVADSSPMVILPSNLAPFPSGLSLDSSKIHFEFSEVPGFTDLTSEAPSPYIIFPDSNSSGTPSSTKVRVHSDRDNGHVLRAANRLVAVLEDLVADLPIIFKNGSTFVIVGGVAYVFNGCRALVQLVEEGHGTQAIIQAQALFEAVVTLCWADRHPEDALNAYSEHDKTIAEYQERISRILDRQATKQSKREDSSQIAYPGNLWTGHMNIGELLLDLDSDWESESDRRHAWLFYRSFSLGQSPAGLNPLRLKAEISETEKRLVYVLGPSNDNMREALVSGMWCLELLGDIVTRHFDNVPTEKQAALRIALKGCWESLQDPLVMKDLGRNDPCPCGGGQKYKYCHGT